MKEDLEGNEKEKSRGDSDRSIKSLRARPAICYFNYKLERRYTHDI